MRPLTAALLVLCCTTWASPARAGRSTVVLAPLGSLGIGAQDTARVERWLYAALGGVSGVRIVGSGQLKKLLDVPQHAECTASAVCLGKLARRVNVELVVAGDVGQLGGGFIVYLRLITAKGEQVRAISGVLEPERALRATARGLAHQLLAPDRYTGTLQVDAGVRDAWIYLDGRRVGRSPMEPLAVSVGTHALRVTHAAHHDFVRFVQVRFEETTEIAAELSPVPVQSTRMKLRSPVRVLEDRELPWYRRIWAVAAMGAVVATAAAVIVAVIPKGASGDREVVVNRP